MSLKWTGDIGIASVLGAAQLVAIVGGGMYALANVQFRLDNAASKVEEVARNTAETTKTLQHAVERNENKTADVNNRLIAVETNVAGLKDTVGKMDMKLDHIQLVIPKPN